MYETPDLSNEFHPQPKPNKGIKMPKSMVKIGKKMKTDAEVRKENVEKFYKVGIVKCECNFKKVCWKDNALSFAHPDKRRKLTDEDLKIVILACIPCHTIIEAWPSEKMKKFILDVIKNRKVQP